MRLWQDRRGVTALEYGVIVGALAFTLVGAFAALAPKLAAIFSNVSTKL